MSRREIAAPTDRHDPAMTTTAPTRRRIRPTTTGRRAFVTATLVASLVAAAVDGGAAMADEPVDPLAAPSGADTTTTTTVAPAPPTTSTPPTTTPTTTAPPPTATTAPTTAPPPSVPPVTVSPAPRNVTVFRNQIANILATIRYMESRGDYTAPPNRGNASGAYQFIASTWNNYGGYAHAYLAPPEVQDARAAEDVERFLTQWNNDVSMIPVMWYYPRAAREPELMDIVPVPSAGNVLTVREYQLRWLGVWAFLSGQAVPSVPGSLSEALARRGLPPELPAPVPVDPTVPAAERNATVAFPVLGPTRLAAPDCGSAQDVAHNAALGATPQDIEAAGLCSEEAPGIVFGVKLQPVLSVTDGVVTRVVDVPGEPIAVTVTDPTGRSYRLAGFNDDTPGTDDGAAPPHLRLTSLARVGTSVRAGQVLGFMGDTDPLPLGVRSDVPTDATVQIPMDAVAPHIRLTITDLDGTPVDAYGPVIDALFRQVCTVGTGPWSSPPNGAGHDTIVTETTDDNRAIDSEWVITPSGQVTAAGWAALIYPSESCVWTPPDAYGPGGAGSPVVPAAWWVPIELSTSIWVRLAVRDEGHLPTVPIRRP